jgi:hypothetical protein
VECQIGRYYGREEEWTDTKGIVQVPVVSCRSHYDATFLSGDISDCGYDHAMAGHKKQNNPVDFQGCLAHDEITYEVATQAVLRVWGYLSHNPGCQEAHLTRFPSVPLHPSVYTTALAQLKAGATLSDIQEKNQSMILSHLYPDMRTIGKASYRWLLHASDTHSLYSQFN